MSLCASPYVVPFYQGCDYGIFWNYCLLILVIKFQTQTQTMAAERSDYTMVWDCSHTMGAPQLHCQSERSAAHDSNSNNSFSVIQGPPKSRAKRHFKYSGFLLKQAHCDQKNVLVIAKLVISYEGYKK